ncbi:MAG: nucleotidyltransferase domain-containing protein [Methanoregula sp.]|nr:nucleotidyltransferase domain-containing protein [Methanoregula sp.]
MKWKVRNFRFYGSIMRNDFRPDSDIDVMVEFSPDTHTTFFDMSSMQDELEALLGRKVDLADRRSVDMSENYIRRKGMLSGKPPVLRQMSYLLDMLIWARSIEKITGNHPPGLIDDDKIAFHALSFNVFQLAVSAGRVDGATREKVPGIPWDLLDETNRKFEDDPFSRDKNVLKNLAWDVVPLLIPRLAVVIPAEREV